ncbi:MAG: alpha-xylosidase [Anaerolineae bacterium]|nr:alpha-xylosidase [Anaerolineae bacterium]MCB9106623.1 alpha-xylosidase [Anaerolineales bacterium]
MKFTDGYWHFREGVTPHFPIHVHDIEMEPDALIVYGVTKRLTQRGDVLNTGLLTVRFSSPMPDVIRVQMWHYKGQRPLSPTFALNTQPTSNLCIKNETDFARLTSGSLTVRVDKGPDWRVDYLDDSRLLTRSNWRGMGYVDTPEGRYIHEQLDLGVGEYVYGLGERFTPFIKNGQVVDLWNEDGGTSSEQAYKNIPFYMTNRGYGVFINHPERVSLEVGSEKVERVQFSVPGETLDYFIINGPTPKEVLTRYTALTGRPALPPAWSFGLWLSTSFTTDYDEATVTRFVQGMADRDIPLHVFHFDCFWMKEFHWTNLEWDRAAFPDPEGMLQRLKERGLHICVWINPYIAQRSALFDEGMAHGYLVKKPNGDVWQWDRWQAGMGLVDFTNPAACRWFQDKLRSLLDMGVDCFKTDFGERIPTTVVYHDGSDPLKMHNYYTQLYNQTVFDLLLEERGPGEAVVFARSATAGGQQFPVHWGGDCTATFESMAESLRGGLSLSLSGFGFWSHDIGGFEQTAPAEVYKRWCGFGLLSSHSRLHGSGSYRVPWLFDDEAVDVLRHFTQLKCRLMPYLYGAAVQAHQFGLPTMRAMVLEFPDDPGCDTLDRQYMLGDSLLVAPVFRADNVVDYYLPAGRWTHFLTGETVEGGGWRRDSYDFFSLPLWVRPNSIIPVGSTDTRPDYDLADNVTFHLFDLAEGASASATAPTIQGEADITLHVRRDGNILHIQADNATKPWRVLLRGVSSVATVSGGSRNTYEQGTLVVPETGVSQLTVELL